jgi:hypothetical protein
MKQQERSNNDPAVMTVTIVVANPEHTTLSSPTNKKNTHTHTQTMQTQKKKKKTQN